MFKLRRYPKREVLEDYQQGFPSKKPRNRKTVFLSAMALALSAVAWYSAEASVQAEFVEEVSDAKAQWRLADVKAGQLLFKKDGDVLYHNAVLHSSEVHFDVSGMLAKAKLTQQFENQSSDWVEAVYVFPLPEKAAVHRMRIKIGDRVIEGQIKEKQQAKKIYQAAKKAGKKVGMIEQQRPNMFTTKVANIAPGEKIDIYLEYTETVSYQQGGFSLRFPMTITPRFFPGVPYSISPTSGEPQSGGLSLDGTKAIEQDATANTTDTAIAFNSAFGWAFNTNQVPDASEISPFLYPKAATEQNLINPITITANIDMGMPLQHIDSAYHNIILSRHDQAYNLRLRQGQVSMEQDFVINWSPAVGSQPKAAMFTEELAGEKYHLLMLLPPSGKTPAKTLPKEVVYIIDTSGSMGGVSIRQAKQSLLFGLETLKPQDSFNIIEFNSHYTPLFQQAVKADSKALNTAKRFVNSLQSTGGTNMLPALQYALKQQGNEQAIRQVIFITDGAVGNESALFKEIHQSLGNSRLFTVGIGSAPNSFFMRKAAEFGRGSFTYIGKINEVNEKMTALFSQLNSPVMKDIDIHWPKGIAVESYPNKIPDLYKDQPLLVNIKTDGLLGDIKVTGKTASQDWEKTITVNKGQKQKWVSKLWAREKVSSLLDEMVKGRDALDVKQDVLDVSLTHQIMSPYTSFIAVDKTVSRSIASPIKKTPVPNARPKGQSPQSFAYPNTATRSERSFYIAIVFLLLAGLWCLPGLGMREVKL